MMPMMPPTIGQRPKAERDADYEGERRRVKPWRRWYSTAVWKAIRRTQLRAQPLCERCLGREVTRAARVVNHRVAHRGVWERFIAGPFESLCKRCHDSEVQSEERRAVG